MDIADKTRLVKRGHGAYNPGNLASQPMLLLWRVE